MRPICLEELLFEQAGRCAVSLQVSGIDHQLGGLAAAFYQFQEDAPKHAQRAPADEAVVNCLVRPIALPRPMKS